MNAKHPAIRWRKEWVPPDLSSNRSNLSLLKWIREDGLKALKEKRKESEIQRVELEPEPTSEMLFLCSYQGCGKTFLEIDALRKHVQIHDGRQHVCYYEGCGKYFSSNFNLKRHILTHTGEKNFICPRAGCGKAFSQDINLRSHMQIHSQENYHVCPYRDCGKRYISKGTLNAHMKVHHEQLESVQNTRTDKPQNVPKALSADRPYVCPHKGCEKSYIHEYKLNLHLTKEHIDSESDTHIKSTKKSKPSPIHQIPPSEVPKVDHSSFTEQNIEVMYEVDGERTPEDCRDSKNDCNDDTSDDDSKGTDEENEEY